MFIEQIAIFEVGASTIKAESGICIIKKKTKLSGFILQPYFFIL